MNRLIAIVEIAKLDEARKVAGQVDPSGADKTFNAMLSSDGQTVTHAWAAWQALEKSQAQVLINGIKKLGKIYDGHTTTLKQALSNSGLKRLRDVNETS